MSDPRILTAAHVKRIRQYEPGFTTEMWAASHEALRRELASAVAAADEMAAEANAAEAEVARLREALSEYGAHKLDCHTQDVWAGVYPSVCTCGLDAAFSAPKAD